MGYDFRNKSYINGILIALNVITFLYLEIAGSSQDILFMVQSGAVFAPAVIYEKEYYRLLTAVFMHFGINHIINNMIVLFALGDHLERALGHVKYLILYLICGVGSNLISMLLNGPDSMVVSAGASGAIFGVTGSLISAVIINRGRLEDLSFKQLAVMVALSLYLGFTEHGVDNTAHVAGLLIGILLGMMLYRKPRKDVDRRENYYEGF